MIAEALDWAAGEGFEAICREAGVPFVDAQQYRARYNPAF